MNSSVPSCVVRLSELGCIQNIEGLRVQHLPCSHAGPKKGIRSRVKRHPVQNSRQTSDATPYEYNGIKGTASRKTLMEAPTITRCVLHTSILCSIASIIRGSCLHLRQAVSCIAFSYFPEILHRGESRAVTCSLHLRNVCFRRTTQ